jgi:hypothetical protein
MSNIVLGWLLISWVLVLLFGFCWGRKWGKAEGERLGLATAPLVWRQASLEAGKCLFCGAVASTEHFSRKGIKG